MSLALLTALIAGCAPSGQRGPAAAAATRFVAAIDQHDGKTACDELTDNAKSSASGATDTPCEKAVLNVKENGEQIRGVQVWGDSAEVKIGTDVVFLRHFHSGWRVSAAGCKPQRHAAYDCDLEG